MWPMDGNVLILYEKVIAVGNGLGDGFVLDLGDTVIDQ